MYISQSIFSLSINNMSLQLVNDAANTIAAAQNEVATHIQLTIIDRIKNRDKVLHAKNMLDLEKKLSFQHNCLPVDSIESSLTQNDAGKVVSKIISVSKKLGSTGTCTYFNIGAHVEGGLINYFTVTTGTVRKCKSVHGDFLTFDGDDFPMILNTYQKIMASALNKKHMLISKIKLLSIGLPTEVAKKQAVLQKFYVADPADNEEVLCSGELKQEDRIYVRPMTINEFDTLFKMEPTKKSTDPVPFLFAAVIKGVDKGVSREELMMLDGEMVNGNNVYTLHAVPEFFIYFSKDVAAV